MTDNNVIKFGKAKKALQRIRKDKQAEANRIKFGRTKAQKQRDTSIRDKRNKSIDDHKRET